MINDAITIVLLSMLSFLSGQTGPLSNISKRAFKFEVIPSKVVHNVFPSPDVIPP